MCLLVVVSFGAMILMAQYQYRLNENQLKDNWGNSRWDVNIGDPASSASNVSVVRQTVAIPMVTLVGFLPLIIAAFLVCAAVLWLAIGIRSNAGSR
jgi:hypothetical protein